MPTPTNPYYQRAFNALAGTLARARQMVNEFALIQYGFDLIKDKIVMLEGSFPNKYQLAGSDLSTALAVTTTVPAGTFHVQADFTALEVSASLDTPSTSGVVTIDVKVGGVSRLATLLTIDANETTSYTAAVPAVFSNPVLLKGQLVVFSITTAGTGAKGLKIGMRGV